MLAADQPHARGWQGQGELAENVTKRGPALSFRRTGNQSWPAVNLFLGGASVWQTEEDVSQEQVRPATAVLACCLLSAVCLVVLLLRGRLAWGSANN
jgi:hypothetical protein